MNRHIRLLLLQSPLKILFQMPVLRRHRSFDEPFKTKEVRIIICIIYANESTLWVIFSLVIKSSLMTNEDCKFTEY